MVCPRAERPDHRALKSHLGATLQFFGARRDILERNQRDRIKPLGCVSGVCAQPVVEHGEADLLQFDVIQPKQRHPQRGVEDLRAHPVNILVLEPLGRIPTAGPRRLVAFAQMLPEFRAVLADAEPGGHREGNDSRRHEGKSARVGLHHLGSPVLELFVQALGPQGGGFHHVRISGDDYTSHFQILLDRF